MFVVDASVALAWCFQDEASEMADLVLGRFTAEEAVAPSIWPLEVANGLRTAERRGRLSANELPRIRGLLGALPIGVEPVDLDVALGDVLGIARSSDLTAYDAAYLWLAIRRDLAVATIDDRLIRACERAGVALVSTGLIST